MRCHKFPTKKIWENESLHGDTTEAAFLFFPKQCVTLRGSYGKGKAS